MQGWVQTALGISSIVSILVNVGVLIALVMIYAQLMPLVTELRSQVKRLGDKGNEIANTAKVTVDRVHDRTEQLLGSAQSASAGVTQKIGAASTALTALFVAMRVVGYAKGLAGGKPKRSVEVKRIRA